MSVTASRRSYASDLLVLGCMLIVACAATVGLILEFDVEPVSAIAAGTAGFAIAAAGHVLVQRAARLARLQAELERTYGSFDADADGTADQHGERWVDHDLRWDLAADGESASGHRAGNDDAAAADGPAPARAPQNGAGGAGDPRAAQSETEVVNGILQRIAEDISAGRRTAEPSPGDVADRAVAEPKALAAEDFDFQLQPQAAAMPSPAAGAGDAGKAAGSEASDKLAAITEALRNERLDVFLEAIHGFADGKARHYEVSIRLSLEDGEQVDDAGYASVAQGSVLLPLIDALKVSHAKDIGLFLLRRGQSGALISQINGQSVSAAEFGDDLATIIGRDGVMAERLVLSFAQDDVHGFTPVQWASIDRLAGLGFRFAIADITNLDMDFEMLGQRGFVFAKLDAEVFITGLPAGQIIIPPADVCRHLAESGLTLVVHHLTNQQQVAEVVGFGALFGQGAVFGGPRPVKSELVRRRSQSAPPVAPPGTTSFDVDRAQAPVLSD